MIRASRQLFLLFCWTAGATLCASGSDQVRAVMDSLKERWRSAEGEQEKEKAAQNLDTFAVLSRRARQSEKNEQRVRELREQNTRLYDQHKELTATVARLDRQLKDRQHSFADRQEEITQKFADYEQRNASLEAQVAQLTAENQQLREAAQQVLQG